MFDETGGWVFGLTPSAAVHALSGPGGRPRQDIPRGANAWSVMTLGISLPYIIYIYINNIELILVGGFNPSEKYKSIGMIIPNIWNNERCSKAPARI